MPTIEQALALAKKAEENSARALRVVSQLSEETRAMQQSVIGHTRGLHEKVDELGKLTPQVAALLKAETERALRETIKEQLDEQRWKKISRWLPLILAIGALLGWAIAHYKP